MMRLASIFVLAGLALCVSRAFGQPPVVGYIAFGTPDQAGGLSAFTQGMRDLGYVERRTVVIEPRWAHGDSTRFDAIAEDLLKLKPAVIVTSCGWALDAIRKRDRVVPVVAACTDAKSGFRGEVASMNRPGGRTTGVSFLAPESIGKRFELLKELKGSISRVGVLNQSGDAWDDHRMEMERVARHLGILLISSPVRDVHDVEGTVAAAAQQGAEALVVLPDAITLAARTRIPEAALRHKLLTVFEARMYVEWGGLLSYGPNWSALLRTVAADYVDRILKGAAPGELPLQQATRLELVVNRCAARALGLELPRSLLLRADEVIECR